MRRLYRMTLASLVIPVMFFSNCGKSSEQARIELGQMDIPYTKEAFIEYASTGDAVVVDLFLTAGMDVNARHFSYKMERATALEATLWDRHYEIAKTLIDHGAEVTSHAMGALARRKGNVEMMKYLLEHFNKADTTYQETLDSILFDAVSWGHIELVKFLLQQGATPSDPNIWKNAEISGQTEITELLKEHGAREQR